jgi:hypothetical protein
LAGQRAYESNILQAGCFSPDMAGFGAGFTTQSVIKHSWAPPIIKNVEFSNQQQKFDKNH